MSALAQIAAGEGKTVGGSDREFDKGGGKEKLRLLKNLGIKIYPQNGSGVSADTDKLILSTAIEETNPDVGAAKRLGVRILHRSQLLAEYVSAYDTVVIAGTSGKSTTAAMLFSILDFCGLGPSVITGGALNLLKSRGLIGNAYRGTGKAMIVEGDESDGSLVRYSPGRGVLLNITKDHKTIDELKNIFLAFAKNCKKIFLNSDDLVSSELIPFLPGAALYSCDVVSGVELLPFSSEFYISGVRFVLPVPGEYNILNAVAAVRVAVSYGISVVDCAAALAVFPGVERRYRLVGQKHGVSVIDDFAHNPAKISAVLKAMRFSGKRILAVYQPHGFTPTKSLRKELTAAFADNMTMDDILIMPDIFYAGGTAPMDISSRDITDAVSARGIKAFYIPSRVEIKKYIAENAREGDVVGVLGARDATLSDFAEDILRGLP